MKFPLLLVVLAVIASIDAGANRATRHHPGRGVTDQPCSLRESVDLKKASRITGIAYSTLREWISRGDLPAYRVNKTRVRVYVEDLQRRFVPVHERCNAGSKPSPNIMRSNTSGAGPPAPRKGEGRVTIPAQANQLDHHISCDHLSSTPVQQHSGPT